MISAPAMTHPLFPQRTSAGPHCAPLQSRFPAFKILGRPKAAPAKQKPAWQRRAAQPLKKIFSFSPLPPPPKRHYDNYNNRDNYIYIYYYYYSYCYYYVGLIARRHATGQAVFHNTGGF